MVPTHGLIVPQALRRTGTILAALVLLSIGFSLPGVTPTAAAQTGNCPNILPNGGFEDDSGWRTQTNGTYSLLSNYLVRSGARAAYLGGVNQAIDTVDTVLNLPSGGPITLRFWWYVETLENGSDADGLSVIVAEPSGQTPQSLLTLSDVNATELWEVAEIDLSAYAGQSILLQFRAQTDETLPTDFAVDDVEVTACGANIDLDFHIFLPVTTQ